MQAICCSSILSGAVADHFVILYQDGISYRYSVTKTGVNIPIVSIHSAIATSNNIARAVNIYGSPSTFPWGLNKFTAIGCDNYAINLDNDNDSAVPVCLHLRSFSEKWLLYLFRVKFGM
ncbi:hypothetical protein WN944_014726 [Citrus x changshan-huyou]|uniref:Uncharacterized protein n=1 Tax=Citrus x changshan-huyou TaxID=2935761 RepID=A0AAP0QLZ2_9ROSI